MSAASQHGLNAITSPRPLLEHLPRYRAEHPVGPETTHLTLIGFPVGALRRRAQRMSAVLGVFTMAVLVAEPHPLIAAAVALVVLPLTLASGPRCDLPVGVALTDRRVVIAHQRGRGVAPSTVEWPRGAVTRAVLTRDVERFWLAGRVHRVTLTGGPGEITTVELTQFDPEVTDQLLCEIGIEVVPHRRDTERVRWWFPKAFVVGVLFTFGVPVTGLAAYATVDGGGRSACIAAVIGLAATALGEVLRRVLFSPRSRRVATG